MSTTAAFAFPLLSIAQPPGRGRGSGGLRDAHAEPGGRGIRSASARPNVIAVAAVAAVAAAAAAAPAAAATAVDPAAAPRSDDTATDATLVARVVSGSDHDAYAVLVRRHQSSVRKLLRRLTRNDHALADDLAQDTFIQAHRNLHQFRGDARFATWIYRIAYNAFLADVRAHRNTEPLGDDVGDIADIASGAPPVERTMALRLDLERALDRLPPAEREALVHCYYLDLSHEEAAYVLQCPLGTVKTHVLRGKQKLKAMLSAYAPPGESQAAAGGPQSVPRSAQAISGAHPPLDEGPMR